MLEKWVSKLDNASGKTIHPRRSLLDFLDRYCPHPAWASFYDRYVTYTKHYKTYTKAEMVQYWRFKGKKKAVVWRITGVSLPTVSKYWKEHIADFPQYSPMVGMLWDIWQPLREVLPDEVFYTLDK